VGRQELRRSRLIIALAAGVVAAAAFPLAQDDKPARRTTLGIVKSVVKDAITMIDRDEKEWVFTVDATTKIVVRGLVQPAATAPDTDVLLALPALVKEGLRIRVRYLEIDGKLRAAEIRVI
jgi:purine nucleoside permease